MIFSISIMMVLVKSFMIMESLIILHAIQSTYTYQIRKN